MGELIVLGGVILAAIFGEKEEPYVAPELQQWPLSYTFGAKSVIFKHPTGEEQVISYRGMHSTSLYEIEPQFGDGYNSYRLAIKNSNGRVTDHITVHGRFRDSLKTFNEGLMNRIGY